MPGPGGANNGVGRTPAAGLWGVGGDNPRWGPPSRPRLVCVVGRLVRAHCSLSWEPERKDGSGCANLTGDKRRGGGGGGGV